MTKADKSRILYVLVLVMLGGGVLGLWWYFGFRPGVLIVMCLVLAVPERIPQFFWREFNAGKRALRRGDHESAKASFLAFLERVRRRPWLKQLMYLKCGMHTRDIEAMALNNLGVTCADTGAIDEAAKWYEAALAVDPEYGVAYSNLALIEYARGDDAAASRLLDRAHVLGARQLTHAVAHARGAQVRSMTDTQR